MCDVEIISDYQGVLIINSVGLLLITHNCYCNEIHYSYTTTSDIVT